MHISEAAGVSTDPVTMTIDRSRLRLFAKATGQTDPVYTIVKAAQQANFPDLLVPPTFLFGIELERKQPFSWLTAHGVNMAHVLHGEQSFDYRAPVFAGEEVTATSFIRDVEIKKNGALTLVRRQTSVTRAGWVVAVLGMTIAIRSAA